MIYERLLTGKENAIPGKHLAKILNIDLREFTKQIKLERQSGVPICAATSGKDKGYFLAADTSDLDQYCRSLDRRLKNLQKTRSAVGKTMERIEGDPLLKYDSKQK